MPTVRKWQSLNFSCSYLNHHLKLGSGKVTQRENLTGKTLSGLSTVVQARWPQMPTSRDRMTLRTAFSRGPVIWEARINILESCCHLPASKGNKGCQSFQSLSLSLWSGGGHPSIWESCLVSSSRPLRPFLLILCLVRSVKFSYSQSNRALPYSQGTNRASSDGV